MTLTSFILVAIGGAFGALCRSLATSKLKKFFTGDFPLPTLIVNLAACFAAGCCTAASLDSTSNLLLLTGFLGGFSTLAAMNYEATSLFADKRYALCFGYLAITYATTLGAACTGFALVMIL